MITRTKKQATTDRLDGIASDLHEISQLVSLCGFATEATRVLQAVDGVAQDNPSVGKLLSSSIEARHEWAEFSAEPGYLLRCAGRQLQDLARQVSDLAEGVS